MPSLPGILLLLSMPDVWKTAYVSTSWQGLEPKLCMRSFSCLLGPYWIVHWYSLALAVLLPFMVQTMAAKAHRCLGHSQSLLDPPCGPIPTTAFAGTVEPWGLQHFRLLVLGSLNVAFAMESSSSLNTSYWPTSSRLPLHSAQELTCV